jgi:hypothetical protein
MISRSIPGFFLLLATTAAAQAPVPVVERIVTQRDQKTRVSVFSNRAVVVSIMKGDERDFFRRITLEEDQYLVYVSALQTDAENLEENPVSSDVGAADYSVQVTLHVGPDAPRLIRFPSMAIVSLQLSRIMGVFDDLQQQVFDASPSAEEVRIWEPREGDRVQLFNGSFAVVAEVWDDGMLVLQHEDISIREVVAPGYRDQVILHIVDPKR